MAAKDRTILKNEGGMAMVIVILMLAIVTVLGIAATQTSTTEVQLATNERRIVDDFYRSEGGLIARLEDTDAWLTDAFLLAGPTAAANAANVDFDGDAVPDARVEIRCIENSGTVIAGLSAPANNLPSSSHTGPPPAGSGTSMKYFAAHRYGVTATSATGNAQIQAGVWKAFPKTP